MKQSGAQVVCWAWGVMRDDSVLVRLALKRLSAGNLEKLVDALENEKNEAERRYVSAGCGAR